MKASYFPDGARRSPARMMCPVCLIVMVVLMGCSDPSADLQVRLTYAMAELDAVKAEVRTLREGEKPAAPTADAPRPVAPEESFREAATQFAAQLESELKDAKVSARAYSDVKTTGTFSFKLTMPDGSGSFREVKGTASPEGKWTFPPPREFAQASLAQPEKPAPRVETVHPPAQAPEPARNQNLAPSGPGLPADETKSVTWGDKPRPPGAVPNTARPMQASPARPAPPRAPSPSLPRADEEVPVSFDRKK